MDVRVEYRYDPESRNWSFAVPSLGIVGGAQTREEAELRAREAVIFTLECPEAQEETPDAEVGYIHLTLDR